MYGLIHKLKKKKQNQEKRKLKSIFKSNNSQNNKKRLAYSVWFCPVLLFSFEKCACCNPLLESTVQFWCLIWPFLYLDINNNSKKKKKRHFAFSKRLSSFCHAVSLLAMTGVHTVECHLSFCFSAFHLSWTIWPELEVSVQIRLCCAPLRKTH